MKILIIDTLIQTVNFDKPVRSGLIKSAMLDANALSKYHETYYMYSGKPTFNYKFKSIIIDDLGTKDWCIANNKKTRSSYIKFRKDSPVIIKKISELKPDVIFIHVHSRAQYIVDIANRFEDTPKIYIFHDAATNNDLFGTGRILTAIHRLRKFNSIIVTNSNYTAENISKTLCEREEGFRKFFPHILENKLDVATYKPFDKVFDYFVYYDGTTSLDVVKNDGFSVNIGRFQKAKGVLDLLELHEHNNHPVKLFGIKDPVWDEGLKDYAKIKESEELYDNYDVCEGYSDEDLRTAAKGGNNIVISCPIEGFGYTAFEMGIHGMPCVILKSGETHATEEYLEKIGASYVSINKLKNKKWKEELYEAMMMTKLTEKQKRKNAQKFLNYFTIENYIKEREELIEMAKETIKKNNTKTLF